MREMRESGFDFEEISESVGPPTEGCRTKANNLGIRKNKGRPVDRHTGITDDGPELHHRKNGRPMAKPPELRHCITCKKMFKSWDRTKNQRCQRCNSLGE